MTAGGGQDIIFSDLLTGESTMIHAYVHMDGPGETHPVKKQKTKPPKNCVMIVDEGLLREKLGEDELG